MPKMLVYPLTASPAGGYAAEFLRQQGAQITDHPSPDVTHLLLDVPSFRPDGMLRCGLDITNVLETLPQAVTVIGGNLRSKLDGHPCMDLLRDLTYAAQNAAITAQAALTLAASKLTATLQETPILILGWGRIGKHLASMLASLGCKPSVLARKEADRAMLHSLGYTPVAPEELKDKLPAFRLILNTVPELLIPEEMGKSCRRCVKIDLASQPGIAGPDVITARGLPGKYLPESAGALMAKTILRKWKENQQ